MKKSIEKLLEVLKKIDEIQESLKGVFQEPDINVFTINDRLEQVSNVIKNQLKALVWAEFCTKHGIEA